MGLLFGKKKNHDLGTPFIHNTQHNANGPRVNVSANPNVVPIGKIEIDVEPLQNDDISEIKKGGGFNSFSYSMGNKDADTISRNGGKGDNGYSASVPNGGVHGNLGTQNLMVKNGSLNNFSAGNNNGAAASLNVGMINAYGNNGVMNAHGNNGMMNAHGNNGMMNAHGNNGQIVSPQSYSPVERVVNIYAISKSLFKIAQIVSSVHDWSSSAFTQNILQALSELDRYLRVLRTPQELRDWAHPLHYRKTGAVIGAGRRITIAHNSLKEWEEKLKLSRNLGQTEQRYFRETFKEVIATFVQLCIMIEMVVPADFNGEINEIARTMRDLVDTASGKLNYVFDDVAHICTTCSVRLSRLGMWKGIQVVNLHWSRQINDSCFTVSKATKVLYVIGQKLYENMTDRMAYDNLTTLTRGIVVQIKKLQEMIQNEPPNVSNVVVTFTNEIIQEHLIAIDAAIKEVSISLNNYVRNNTINGEPDVTIESIGKIIAELEVIKESVRNPDIHSLFSATAAISDSLEKFCASVYHILHLLGDQNEVIKEQVMETMQQALHACLQLQLVAVCKGVYHNVLNPENTMLICIRFLLLGVSIIIDAVDFMRTTATLEDDTEGVALGPEEINDVIVYILHYGRALFRGDTEVPGNEPAGQISDSGDVEIPAPTSVHNNYTPNNAPNFKVIKAEESEDNRKVQPPTHVHQSPPKPAAHVPQLPPKSTTHVQQLPPKEEKPVSQVSNNSIQKPVAVEAPKPAPVPAPVVSNKFWLDMTTEEFKTWCDVNGKPSPDFNEHRLPPGFEKSPVKPVYKEGSTREEYKAYMVAKYEYETWENKLVLFNIKLKKKLDELK